MPNSYDSFARSHARLVYLVITYTVAASVQFGRFTLSCTYIAMLGFATDLWNSIFEPGTTPALERATHISFTCLLITVLLMLYWTKSLHFVALFILSTGLWVAVTWFIKEVKEFKKQEEHKKNDAIAEGAANSASSTATATATATSPGAALAQRQT